MQHVSLYVESVSLYVEHCVAVSRNISMFFKECAAASEKIFKVNKPVYVASSGQWHEIAINIFFFHVLNHALNRFCN